jgi:MFS family permease
MYVGLVLLGVSYGITSSALWGTIGIYTSGADSLGLVYAIPYSAFNCGALAFALVSGALLDCTWALLTFWCCISGLAVGVAFLWVLAERRSAQPESLPQQPGSGQQTVPTCSTNA